MSSVPGGQAPLDVLAIGYEPSLDRVIRELRIRGIRTNVFRSLEGASVEATALVVALDQPLESTVSEAELREFTARYDDVIPVSSRPAGQAAYFHEISHLLLTQVSAQDAAETIVAVASIGGRRIVEWNRLLDRSREWAEDSGHVSLLKDAEVPPAELLAAEVSDVFDPAAVRAVRDYLDASRSQIARRRRRAMAVLSAGALALVALIVLAVVQTFNANDSRNQAEEARKTADADRLADYAGRLQDADPDLPSILVSAAAQLKPTDRVVGAANEVAARTWPHRTVELGGLPRRMSSAANAPRLAMMVKGTSTAQIYDTGTAEQVAELEVGDVAGLRSAELSPDGKTLAVQRNDEPTIRLYAVDGSGAAEMKPEAGNLLGWYDAEHLALATGSALTTVPRTGGAPVAVIELKPGEELRAFARSADGTTTAAISADALYLTRTGTGPKRMQMKGAMDVAVAGSGDRIAVAGYPKNALVRWTSGDEPGVTHLDESLRGTSVSRIGESEFAFAGWEGRLMAVSGGDLISSVLAHSGGRFLTAVAGDKTLATAGQDRRLRFWRPRGSAGTDQSLPFGLRDVREAVFADAGDNPLIESSRNQLTIQSDAPVATVIHQPNYMWTVDVERRTAVKDRPTVFGRLNTDMALSPAGSGVAIVTSKGVMLGRIEHDGSPKDEGRIDGTPIGMTIAGTGRGLLAVSDDSSTVVLADSTHVYCWSKAGGAPTRQNHTFDADRRPIAMVAETVDGTPKCRVLTADGYVRNHEGKEARLRTGESGHGSTLAAGAFRGVRGGILAVTEHGRIYEIDGLRGRRIGTVGSGVEPFAVRLSPSGRTVAVMGRAGTSFVDRSSGRVFQRVPADGTSYLNDVGFRSDTGDDAVLAITSRGAIRSISLSNTCDGPICEVNSPRPPTEQERADFQIPDGIGE